MARWKALGVSVGAVAVAVLGATLLPAYSQGHGEGEEVMNLCDQNRRGFSHDVDVDGDGFSSGDYFVLADKLLYAKSGKKAGRLNGQITIVRPIGNRDAVIHGSVLVFLPTGKLSVAVGGNFSDFEEGTSFPITGGAGHFAHATGSVRIKNGPCGGEPGLRMRIVTKH